MSRIKQQKRMRPWEFLTDFTSFILLTHKFNLNSKFLSAHKQKSKQLLSAISVHQNDLSSFLSKLSFMVLYGLHCF